MLTQTDLNTLKKDDRVDHFLLVRKCETKTTRQNKPYLNLELGDRSALLNANVWDRFEDISPKLSPGIIVKITGTIEEFQGSLQIKVSSISLPKRSDKVSPEDFLPRSKRDIEEMSQEFFKRMDSITDGNIKSLLKLIFTEENFEKFSRAPAGKSWHHAYIHGLIEHTLEIIRICDLMCDIHPEINRDVLIAGAMLHDFGKTEELRYDSTFDYTDKGKLIGHIVITAMLIEEKSRQINNFPVDLKECLIHLVLSHQGKLEYASPVVPKTVEAIALYLADELSAKVNAYKNAIANELKGDSNWTKFISIVSTDLYSANLKRSEDGDMNKSLFD